MKHAQDVEIRELARGWKMNKEQLDGLVEHLFGVSYLSEISVPQADQVIAMLRRGNSPTRLKQAAKMADLVAW